MGTTDGLCWVGMALKEAQTAQAVAGIVQSPASCLGLLLAITFLPASLLWRFIKALLEEAPLLLSRMSTKDCEKATP